QSYPQADAAIDQAPPVNSPPPWSGWSGADPNFILANADADGVQEAQQTRPPGRGTPPPVPPGSPVLTAPGASRTQPPLFRRAAAHVVQAGGVGRRNQRVVESPPRARVE